MSGGICGVVQLNGAPVDMKLIGKMALAAEYRALDGITYTNRDNAGFAHYHADRTNTCISAKRSIQYDQRCVAVLHGQLTNRVELLNSLLSAGVIKEKGGVTDVDLVQAAYIHWKTDFPTHLLGDFAIAVWDSLEKRLFLVRDSLGVMPLYFAVRNGRLSFGTEVGQVRVAIDSQLELDRVTIAAHICGLAQPHQRTFFKQIRQLPPATTLVMSNERIREERYWKLNPERRIRYGSSGDYVDAFRTLLDKCVGERLDQDTRYGVMLSGGLDSSAITAVAAERLRAYENPNALVALTWDFAQEPALKDAEEFEYAQCVAKYCHLPLESVAAHHHWPLSDHSPEAVGPDSPFRIQYEELHKATIQRARELGITSLLTGVPGDPEVGGPVHAYADYLIGGHWLKLYRSTQEHARRWKRSHWSVMRSLCLAPLLRAVSRKGGSSFAEPPGWLSPALLQSVGWNELCAECLPQLDGEFQSLAQRERYKLLSSKVLANVVVWAEGLAARAGVRYLHPWMDRRLYEFCLAIPQDILINSGSYKNIVRESFYNSLPGPVLNRQYRAMPTPLFHWGMRTKEADYLLGLVNNMQASSSGFIVETRVREHLQAYLEKKIHSEHPLWFTITLEIWLRKVCKLIDC